MSSITAHCNYTMRRQISVTLVVISLYSFRAHSTFVDILLLIFSQTIDQMGQPTYIEQAINKPPSYSRKHTFIKCITEASFSAREYYAQKGERNQRIDMQKHQPVYEDPQ